MHPSRALVIIGGLILCIGARLPWISVPALFNVSHGDLLEGIEVGWEDNGIITGGIGLILLLIGLLHKGKAGTRYSVPGLSLAAYASFVVVGCFMRVLEINPSAGFFAGTDVGIYVTLLGAILALVGAMSRIQVPYKPLNGASI
jgi:hypothetical protein